MTEEMETLYLVRGFIASLPPADQAKVEALAQELRDKIEPHGVHGFLAVSIVGAECSAKEAKNG